MEELKEFLQGRKDINRRLLAKEIGDYDPGSFDQFIRGKRKLPKEYHAKLERILTTLYGFERKL